MPRATSPDEIHEQRRKLELHDVNKGLEGLAQEIARNQNYIGAVSGESFSVEDTLWVNSALCWKSIDTQQAWCDYYGYSGDDQETFLESYNFVKVDIRIVDSQEQEHYVEENIYD